MPVKLLPAKLMPVTRLPVQATPLHSGTPHGFVSACQLSSTSPGSVTPALNSNIVSASECHSHCWDSWVPLSCDAPQARRRESSRSPHSPALPARSTRYIRAASLFQLDGMLPVSWLPRSDSTCRLPSCPQDAGSCPTKALLDASREVR